MRFIPDDLFVTKTNVVYPPFKNGLYMEEYFLNYMSKHNKSKDKEARLYIPALWTNFQIEPWFPQRREYMQKVLDKWILDNPNPNGYFVVVQHDDGPMLCLPQNTKIYGACFGDIPLPLIYEDIEYKLENIAKEKSRPFKSKCFLCSFVGSITNNIRKNIVDIYKNNPRFKFSIRNGWTNQVQKDHQEIFIDFTVNSKFVLAPRGYGRSSFRFFEILKLGAIPIYIWDDKEWLPYKDVINYDDFSISIHISEIYFLEEILTSINEKRYNYMLKEYEKNKHMFEMEYICKYVLYNKEDSILGLGIKTIPSNIEEDIINITFKNEEIIKPKVLLVVIAIGDRYLWQYNQIFRRSHENYAKKHGYDFKVISEFLDPTYKNNKMSIYFQKLLVSDMYYEIVVFIDSDILININAPPIHLSEDFKDHIGIVDEYSQPTPEIRLKIQRMMGWETCATDYYKLCGFDLKTTIVLNSGVLIIQPKKHKDFLENIYSTYLPLSMQHSRGPHYEQTSLGYELQKKGNYKLLSNKWNAIWNLYKMYGAKLEDIFKENYFIHFAGGTDIERVYTLEKFNI